MTADQSVTTHYRSGHQADRIRTAVESLGRPPTTDDLAGLDFHIGGRPATLDLIRRLSLSHEDRVLDIGCGLGGTAQTIATTHDATVLGIDITPGFVEIASWLAAKLRLDHQIQFSCADAAQAAAIGRTFTAATMLHVGMNVADKAATFAGLHTALEPAAAFGIFDVMAGPNMGIELEFPLPWASAPTASFVEPAEAYVAALEDAGFAIEQVEDRSAWCLETMTRRAPTPRSPLHLGLVMGAEITTKVSHMTAALRSGRIAPTVIIARRS